MYEGQMHNHNRIHRHPGCAGKVLVTLASNMMVHSDHATNLQGPEHNPLGTESATSQNSTAGATFRMCHTVLYA